MRTDRKMGSACKSHSLAVRGSLTEARGLSPFLSSAETQTIHADWKRHEISYKGSDTTYKHDNGMPVLANGSADSSVYTLLPCNYCGNME